MEVNEEFYTPGRGWERVDAVGITRARVDGEKIKIILRGHDGKPLGLHSIRVSRSSPTDPLR